MLCILIAKQRAINIQLTQVQRKTYMWAIEEGR